MAATHYHSATRGPVEIASMVMEHARNARDKLQREEPHRSDEIAALSAHVAAKEAELAAGGVQ